ncbi:MAG: hypothetical protein V3W41_04205 [Planctomycetota bacterium]
MTLAIARAIYAFGLLMTGALMLVVFGPKSEGGQFSDAEKSAPSLSPGPGRDSPASFSQRDDDAFPPTLSKTGYFESVSGYRLNSSFVAFEVNAPYWSDDAQKLRAVRMPPGIAVKFEANKPWFFPVGTTFVKTFQLSADGETKRIETRIVRRAKFGWLFSTYIWNEEQTEAKLEMDGPRFPVTAGHTSQAWGVPHQLDCLECHNDKAGRVLGFNLRQLNRVEKTKTGSGNQLHRLQRAGVLRAVPDQLKATPSFCSPYDEKADLDDRARTYLQVNCSMCHQPGTPQTTQFNLPLDLRRQRPIYETGLLQLDPNNPTGPPLRPRSLRSTLFLNRVGAIGQFRMPPLGSLMIDEKAHVMLKKWFARFLN